ncbi:FAD-dependent monooxygenase [Peribacillus muralis]|uniref:FAD-dependent monooxygenase n=1 Tax=Peribacillus muralis TaxID=264697 RepID=UPI00070DB81C|nr:FAD-dependent monooxygenase [Peribacillus muralis]
MLTTKEQTDVLIVGAGPVGLILASELLRRGVSCRVIDQADAPPTTSRAFGIHPRTMELFERVGIADAIEERAQKIYDMRAFTDGHELTNVVMDPAGLFTRYTCTYSLPQVYTEEIMRARLAELGGKIEYRTRLEKFEQDEHGVTALVSGEDGQNHQIRASWLVGCDGGHSTVRKQLGLPFEGTSSETWLVADVHVDWELEREERDTLYILFSEEGGLVAFPFPEPNHWRLLDINPDVEHKDDRNAVAEQLTKKLRSAIGSSTAVVRDPSWVSLFTIQQRRVPHARVQRAFVAGDAAHCHSPASAQGMNTGVQDAFNLGWKLAQVCRREAPESVLYSYSAEREPVAASVLASTQNVTRFLSMHDANGRWLRNSLISGFTSNSNMRESFLKRFTPEFFELGVAYLQSPLVAENWHQSFKPYERQPKGITPGERVPDYPFHYVKGVPRHTLYEFLNTTEYALLLFSAESADEDYRNLEQIAQDVRDIFGDIITPIFVVPNPHIQKRLRWNGKVLVDSGHPYHKLHYFFGAKDPSVYVIRPDGYVAHRNQPASLTHVKEYLQTVLSTQL